MRRAFPLADTDTNSISYRVWRACTCLYPYHFSYSYQDNEDMGDGGGGGDGGDDGGGGGDGIVSKAVKTSSSDGVGWGFWDTIG